MTFLLIENLSNLVCALCVLAAAQGMTLEPAVGYATWPEGSIVRINCSHEHPVKWIIPLMVRDRIPAENTKSEGGYLQITGASLRNTGLYTCQSTEGHHMDKTIYVKVRGHNGSLRLWRFHKERAVKLITLDVEQIHLSASVPALPLMSVRPNITWWYFARPDLKPTRIRHGHRFNVSMDLRKATVRLTVMNPSADDAGTYRVVVSDEHDPYEETFLEWTLLAAGKTAVHLRSVDIDISVKGDLFRYLRNQWHWFQCVVQSIPSPHITFEFVPCLTPEDCTKNPPETPTFKFDPTLASEDCVKNYPEVVDVVNRPLNASSILPNYTYCTMHLYFTQPGKLSCSASSTSPKHYDIDQVYIGVTEVKGEIVVQNPHENDKVFDLNEFELKCGASKRLYSEPMWKYSVNHSTFQLIDNATGVTIKNNNTDFTFWSTLVIEPPFLVNRTGYNEYMCVTFDNEGRERGEITSVDVKSGRDARLSINKEVQRGSSEILVCDAEGSPSPSIRWYKVGSDNVSYRIDEGEHADPDLYEFREGRKFLSIINATEQIEGEYICQVSNGIGFRMMKYTVRLRSVEKQPPEVPVNNLSRTAFLIGIFVCLAVIVAGIFMVICTKRKTRSKNRFPSSVVSQIQLVQVEQLSLQISVPGECLTSVTLESVPVVSQNQPLQVEQPSPHISVPGDWSEELQLNPRWEFPVEKLKLGDELGRGAFGVVKIAEAIGIKANEDTTIVAVKKPKHKTEEAATALAKELKIMDHVGAHLNIANLLGACTKHLAQQELYVIVEYCKYGSLDNFLRSHRDNFIDEVNKVTGNLELHSNDNSTGFSVGVSRLNSNYIGGSSGYSTGETVQSNTTPHSSTTISSNTLDGEDDYLVPRILLPPSAESDLAQAALETMSTTDLLCWGYQIASGMDYLGRRKIVHCDLATRNVLLAEGKVAKLCDFGLAKDLGIYLVRNPDRPLVRKRNERLPIKWLSIEAIEHLTFSIQSDVWAYGVVLWELFTLGSTPYPCINARDLLDYLKNGNRMNQPEHATRAVYNLMKECWNETPELRPSFKECAKRLGSSLEEEVKQCYSQLSDQYLDLNKDLDKDRDYLEAWLEPTYENVMARGRVNGVEICTGDPAVHRDEQYRNGAEEDAVEMKNLPPQPDVVMTSAMKRLET